MNNRHLMPLTIMLTALFTFALENVFCQSYTIVSSEKGEIGALIIYSSPADFDILKPYIIDLEKKVGKDVLKIVKIQFPENYLAIRALNKSIPGAINLDFDNLMRESLSSMDYKKLKKAAPNKNMNDFSIDSNNKKNVIDDIVKELSREIKTANTKFIIDVFDNKFLPDYHYGGDCVGGRPEQNFWVQDHFISTQQNISGKTKVKLFYSANDQRCEYSAKTLSDSFPDLITCEGLKYHYIEGGNILAGEDFILIGKNILYRNMKDSHRTDVDNYRDEMELYFKDKFHVKHVVWIGFDNAVTNSEGCNEIHQQIFHIDMYIGLGGMVGNKQRAYLAYTSDKFYNSSFLRKHPEINPSLVEINLALDNVEQNIIEYRNDPKKPKGLPEFEFLRIPLLIGYCEGALNCDPANNGSARINRYKSYNNVIVEKYTNKNGVDVRKIFSPFYNGSDYYSGRHFYDIEYKNVLIQAENQYEQDSITEFLPLEPCFDNLKNGALNCITKILYRIPSQ